MSRRPRRLPLAVTLRRGRISDLDALLAIEQQLFGSHLISRRSFRRFLSLGANTLLVAESTGDVVGYVLVLYRLRSAIARLYSIGVAARLQRRGVARRLMAAAEAKAMRRGRRQMRLEVRSDDPGAIALYRTSGYILIGRRARYYEGRIDALRFAKPLVPKLGKAGPRPAKKSDSRKRIGFDGGDR